MFHAYLERWSNKINFKKSSFFDLFSRIHTIDCMCSDSATKKINRFSGIRLNRQL